MSQSQMSALCKTFPTLVAAPGTDPWDVSRFLFWLCFSGAPSAGAQHAGRFVLSVWSPGTDWGEMVATEISTAGAPPHYEDGWLAGEVRKARFDAAVLRLAPQKAGPFDLAKATATWDHQHRAACAAWLLRPFFP